MIPESLKNTIVQAIKPFNPEKIILFGSFAYGSPQMDSDIDIFVIKDITEKEVRDYRVNINKVLWQQLKDKQYPIDVLIDSPHRIKQRIESGDQFYQKIITEGENLL
ncbi:nucleotidyltransferase domain-containing protein [Anaerophaga thermohalophila]|jgi:predicted nucleotidyltransferase|uniref:nucleotidyltransferase domain-containing protein n=1 Tax=Anaerophaga thermohalophila TaxID=177400 RepID=UPI0002E91D7C|nr:nucleotidyltransferase domain-containing protein [Anaerophaga thermohalophila]